jgi:hypothetical protein
MKRVGPELKKPEVKVPQGLNDFYQDLRDRRLLPVMALIAVAIVAVPLLLGSGKKAEVPASTTEALAEASSSAVDKDSKLVVVRSTPGLRAYKKRLKGKPSDPFKQGFAAPAPVGESSGEREVELPSVTTTTTEPPPSPVSPTPEPSPPVSTPSPSPSPSPGPSSPPKHIENPSKANLTFYAWAINVKVTKQDGSASSSDTANKKDKKSNDEGSVRKGVLPQTALPGDKAPVVTYMGASRKKPGRAVLLVSSNVKSVFGETSCANKAEDFCQLIEVEPGFPVTLVYGFNEVRYTINVLKLELVSLGHS